MSSPSSQYFSTATAPPPAQVSTELTDDLPQRVFTNAANGFFEWRPHASGFTFSPSFAAMLGYVPGRLPLTVAVIAAHIFPDDYARFKLCLAKAMLSGGDTNISFRMINQAANVSWFQLQLRVIAQTDDGQIDNAVGCVSNIDHLMQNIESSRIHADNEHWLRQTIRRLLQQQDDAALDNCLTEFCNRVKVDHIALRQAYREGERYRLVAKGCHRRESVPLDFSRIILRKHLPYEFSRAELGEPVLIEDFKQVRSLSPVFKQRVDELHIKSLATIPIFYQGQIDYYLSLIMTSDNREWDEHTVRLAEALGDALAQVAARRRISQTLELSEARFQNALEASQDGIWDWDLSNDTFFVTPTMLYMLGYDEDFLPLDRGKIAKLLVAPTTLNDFFDDNNFIKGRYDKTLPFRHHNGDIVNIWVRAQQTQWDEKGQPTRCVGVNIDVTRFNLHHEAEENAAGFEPAQPNSDDRENKVISAESVTKTIVAPQSIEEALRQSKVLLAEDNPINQQVATGILKRKGINVTIVNNGQEAVDMLNTSEPNAFDCILMDMEMPVLDGYAATKVLRDNELFRDIPIIALTAHARDEDRQTCLNLGMNDHIAKPVKPDLLYAAIARQLEQRQQLPH